MYWISHFDHRQRDMAGAGQVQHVLARMAGHAHRRAVREHGKGRTTVPDLDRQWHPPGLDRRAIRGKGQFRLPLGRGEYGAARHCAS